jgi:hypothetical protein
MEQVKNYHAVLKDLQVVQNEEDEMSYYFNEDMLNNGIFITESTIINNQIESGSQVETMVNVNSLSNNAQIFTLYWDELLSPIQTYRIFKDIVELYKDHALEEFLSIIEELSTSHISSAMQSKAENRISVRAGMQEEMRFLKSQL